MRETAGNKDLWKDCVPYIFEIGKGFFDIMYLGKSEENVVMCLTELHSQKIHTTGCESLNP